MSLLKNFAAIGARSSIQLCSGLFVGAWMTRYLGPDKFGTIALAFSLVSLGRVFSDFGTKNIVLRDVSENEDSVSRLLPASLIITGVGSFLAFWGVFLAARWLQPGNELFYKLTLILSLQLVCGGLVPLEAVCEARQKNVALFKATTLSTLISAGIKVALIISKSDVYFIAFSIVSQYIIEFILAAWFSRDLLKLYSFSVFPKDITYLLKSSYPILLTTLTLIVQARTDQFMLGYLLNDVEVGLYTAALRIPEALAFLPTALYATYYPKISRCSKSMDLKDNPLYRRYLNVIVSTGFLIGLLVAVSSYPIISCLYGQKFIAASPILAIFALRILLAHYGSARQVYLLKEGLLKFGTISMIAGTIFNIVLNYLFIPSFGGVGAAFASCLSFIVTTFVLDLTFPDTRKHALYLLNPGNLFPRFSIVQTFKL